MKSSLVLVTAIRDPLAVGRSPNHSLSTTFGVAVDRRNRFSDKDEYVEVTLDLHDDNVVIHGVEHALPSPPTSLSRAAQ
ncbi:hypothetical protein FCM35_KLT19805 [Carex littledalei]|uniref:Uncharacterized protein n=1 Tax=Carex littledalei TaxID=544730 RepID=A0A833R965_9POAL|nr:hypothetical protein FCM35_KLT19805 [Carex littledalei]